MLYQSAGEMAEWSIALPWKGSNWATGSGVRIPVSPPDDSLNSKVFKKKVTNLCHSDKVLETRVIS